jgi:hypothetical protein
VAPLPLLLSLVLPLGAVTFINIDETALLDGALTSNSSETDNPRGHPVSMLCTSVLPVRCSWACRTVSKIQGGSVLFCIRNCFATLL